MDQPAPTRVTYPVTYSERLGVPLRWWVQGTMMVASLWLALVVALPQPVAWAISGCALALLAGLFLAYGSARIEVGPDGLRAGRARIDARYLGAGVALDAEETRRTAGREADARAYLLLRPYITRAVRVEIADQDDPTPYWLVSSRHPDALAGALTTLTRTSD